jgi:hypothetical protein
MAKLEYKQKVDLIVMKSILVISIYIVIQVKSWCEVLSIEKPKLTSLGNKKKHQNKVVS